MLEIVRRALAALKEQRAAAHAELNAIAPTIEARGADATATPEEEARAAALISSITDLDAKIGEHEARVAELERIEERAAAATATLTTGLQFIKPADKAILSDLRAMNVTQLTDIVKRGAEERGIESDHAARLIQRHRRDMDWVRSIATRSTDAYASAFGKVMTGQVWDLTAEERAALAVGTSTQGGALVPTHLDPTIILTNTGSSNIIRQLARVVTLTTGKQWNGVTSAGMSASFDAELAEVSDDTPVPTTAVNVPLYTARAFAQSSIEAVEDIENLASDLLMMFADARDRLEGAKFAVGSGTAEPTGVFTSITGSQAVTSTTAATIGLVDLLAVKTALGQRWRGRSSWVYNPTYGDAIRQLGTALSANYTVDATGANADKLIGRPVYETDDAPTTQTTTVKDPELILGDFSNYLIADKPGSFNVKYIDVMFNTATNLPDGRVGWFATWRTGGDSINDAAFRVLLDKTSA